MTVHSAVAFDYRANVRLRRRPRPKASFYVFRLLHSPADFSSRHSLPSRTISTRKRSFLPFLIIFLPFFFSLFIAPLCAGSLLLFSAARIELRLWSSRYFPSRRNKLAANRKFGERGASWKVRRAMCRKKIIVRIVLLRARVEVPPRYYSLPLLFHPSFSFFLFLNLDFLVNSRSRNADTNIAKKFRPKTSYSK